MHFTKRTYYCLGIIAAICNSAGGALLATGLYAGYLFQVGTVFSAGMMLFLAARYSEKRLKYAALLGAALCLCGFIVGAAGVVCGALAWPVFALPHFLAAAQGSPRRSVSGLVLLAGAVQLAGSFVPMPDMLRICMAIAISATQGVLAWVLYREEKVG